MQDPSGRAQPSRTRRQIEEAYAQRYGSPNPFGYGYDMMPADDPRRSRAAFGETVDARVNYNRLARWAAAGAQRTANAAAIAAIAAANTIPNTLVHTPVRGGGTEGPWQGPYQYVPT